MLSKVFCLILFLSFAFGMEEQININRLKIPKEPEKAPLPDINKMMEKMFSKSGRELRAKVTKELEEKKILKNMKLVKGRSQPNSAKLPSLEEINRSIGKMISQSGTPKLRKSIQGKNGMNGLNIVDREPKQLNDKTIEKQAEILEALSQLGLSTAPELPKGKKDVDNALEQLGLSYNKPKPEISKQIPEKIPDRYNIALENLGLSMESLEGIDVDKRNNYQNALEKLGIVQNKESNDNNKVDHKITTDSQEVPSYKPKPEVSKIPEFPEQKQESDPVRAIDDSNVDAETSDNGEVENSHQTENIYDETEFPEFDDIDNNDNNNDNDNNDDDNNDNNNDNDNNDDDNNDDNNDNDNDNDNNDDDNNDDNNDNNNDNDNNDDNNDNNNDDDNNDDDNDNNNDNDDNNDDNNDNDNDNNDDDNNDDNDDNNNDNNNNDDNNNNNNDNDNNDNNNDNDNNDENNNNNNDNDNNDDAVSNDDRYDEDTETGNVYKEEAEFPEQQFKRMGPPPPYFGGGVNYQPPSQFKGRPGNIVFQPMGPPQGLAPPPENFGYPGVYNNMGDLQGPDFPDLNEDNFNLNGILDEGNNYGGNFDDGGFQDGFGPYL